MRQIQSARKTAIAQAIPGLNTRSILLIDVTQSYQQAVAAGDTSPDALMRRFRAAWTGRPDRRKHELIGLCVGRTIFQVLKNPRWIPSTTKATTWTFDAEPAPELAKMVGVHLGSHLKLRNPLLYVNC